LLKKEEIQLFGSKRFFPLIHLLVC